MDGGLKRFQQRMRAIPVAVRLGVQPALMKSGEEIAATMQVLAPENTGALKASIEVTGPGKATPAYSQPGGSLVVPENAVAVTAGNTDVRYAHLVEYGTSKGKDKGKDTAQPYFWPGFRMNRKRAEDRVKRAIRKAVKENWGS